MTEYSSEDYPSSYYRNPELVVARMRSEGKLPGAALASLMAGRPVDNPALPPPSFTLGGRSGGGGAGGLFPAAREQQAGEGQPAPGHGQDTGTVQGRIYQVKSGDTLWGIAHKVYGNPKKWAVIARANGLANPDLIRPGDALRIPVDQADALEKGAS